MAFVYSPTQRERTQYKQELLEAITSSSARSSGGWRQMYDQGYISVFSLNFLWWIFFIKKKKKQTAKLSILSQMK